ncbi:DUF1127 domain-containing protein [Pseudooceanicola algae]|uniref:DUF1127 domain-containing protein n=1 Tax=Pseudooceanicola algae TaxID=1537215 RepID=A0A418SK00_9RHOB|nr:DUF1127 domain-containing protein [Pseudooceanicola algae]QPM92209.1 hypothetical protein PSAL_034730 [Pseudooceanicola algae]
MAQTFTNFTSAPRSYSFTQSVRNFFDSLGRAMQASRQSSALIQMSDAQLNRIGLKREDIADHVFKTNFAD